MGTDTDIAVVRKVFHEGSTTPIDAATATTVFTEDFVCHGPPGMDHSHAAGQFGPEHCIFQDAFAGMRFTILDITADGDDRVRGRFEATGRHVRPYRGIEPTGHERSFVVTASFRLSDGKICEARGTLNAD